MKPQFVLGFFGGAAYASAWWAISIFSHPLCALAFVAAMLGTIGILVRVIFWMLDNWSKD